MSEETKMPPMVVKFIHLEDSIPYGLKVYSQFTNVEQDERIFLQKNFYKNLQTLVFRDF